MHRLGRWGRQVLTWALVGKGQLKRGTDRVEMGFRLLLLAALVAAVPLGLVVGARVQGRETIAAADQLRDRHQVHAVVLADPHVPAGATPDTVVRTEVAWFPAAGTKRTAVVAVPLTAHAGDRVPLWVTTDGLVTEAPLDPDLVAANAVSMGFLTVVGLPLVAWGVLALARMALNVRRARQWQEDWLAVEPMWRSRGR